MEDLKGINLRIDYLKLIVLQAGLRYFFVFGIGYWVKRTKKKTRYFFI